jgi:hypothetical protein
MIVSSGIGNGLMLNPHVLLFLCHRGSAEVGLRLS